MLTGKFTRSQLQGWKVKDLKALLNKQNINISKCKEKSDLIDVIISNYGGSQNLYRRGTEQELLVQQMAVSRNIVDHCIFMHSFWGIFSSFENIGKFFNSGPINCLSAIAIWL